jgi:hypothetical protein
MRGHLESIGDIKPFHIFKITPQPGCTRNARRLVNHLQTWDKYEQFADAEPEFLAMSGVGHFILIGNVAVG